MYNEQKSDYEVLANFIMSDIPPKEERVRRKKEQSLEMILNLLDTLDKSYLEIIKSNVERLLT